MVDSTKIQWHRSSCKSNGYFSLLQAESRKNTDQRDILSDFRIFAAQFNNKKE
jgi:hypothetical protein